MAVNEKNILIGQKNELSGNMEAHWENVENSEGIEALGVQVEGLATSVNELSAALTALEARVAALEG